MGLSPGNGGKGTNGDLQSRLSAGVTWRAFQGPDGLTPAPEVLLAWGQEEAWALRLLKVLQVTLTCSQV